MTPHEAKRKLVGEWARKADADLDLAQHLCSEGAVFPNAIAFHCQQAVEKFIKAYLVWRETDFPKTHDIKALLNLAAVSDNTLAASLQDAVALTANGVALRYPGDRPDTTPTQAQEAVALAQKVRKAVYAVLVPALS